MSVLERFQREKARAMVSKQINLVFDVTEEEFIELGPMVALGNGGMSLIMD
jgi:hypothetical protein